ncbi:hypothetical protein D3C75_758240 [compost metagenome]
MQVILVCKKEKDNVTLRKEYPFVFDSEVHDCDGYIIEDNFHQHWMELPSNSHRFGNDEWKSSEYFAEVVIDPEN